MGINVVRRTRVRVNVGVVTRVGVSTTPGHTRQELSVTTLTTFNGRFLWGTYSFLGLEKTHNVRVVGLFRTLTLDLRGFVVAKVVGLTQVGGFVGVRGRFPFSVLVLSGVSDGSSALTFSFSSPLVSDATLPSYVVAEQLPCYATGHEL